MHVVDEPGLDGAGVVHVVLTTYAQGVGVRSPQMPELFSGYVQLSDVLSAVPDLLQFGGAPEEARVVEHREFVVTTPDDQILLLRVADDAEFPSRAVVLGAIRRALGSVNEELIDSLRPTALGEYVVIAALRTDTVDWLTSQADRPGEPVNIATSTADGGLQFAAVVRSDEVLSGSYEEVEGPEVTIGDLVDRGSITSDDTHQLQLVSH